MPDWLGAQRSAAACDRILDAASALFAGRGVEAVAMFDIAKAAGCSRATLYRYFPSRARDVNRRIAEEIAGIHDPRDRLLAALIGALRLVRDNPALAAWFTDTAMGAQAAEGSEVVQAMTAGFLLSVEAADVAAAQRQARWLVRVLTSLLTVPGRDDDEERAMLAEFVVPRIAASPRGGHGR